jgi:rhamnosyltransferase
MLREIIASLREQSVSPHEIILVDSSERCQPDVFISGADLIIPVKKTDFDHGVSRNLGARRAKGDFLVFFTQDACPAGFNTIAELIRPMQEDPSIAMCYGRHLPRPEAGRLEQFARIFNYPEISLLKRKEDIGTMGLKTFFCSNSCAAYRRDVFELLSGFKAGVIVNEDMHFAARAVLRGYSVYYAASAKVYHSHNYSLAQICRRYINIGRFFADNAWLMKHVAVGRYGSSMLKCGLKAFYRERNLFGMVALLVESAVKLMGFQCGWTYHKLMQIKCTKDKQTQA